MAKPITPTPRLNVKESVRFLEDMECDRDRPMGPVETPKIKNVIKKILNREAIMRKPSYIALMLVFLAAGCAVNQAQPQAEVDIKPVMDQLIEVHKEYIEAINTFQLMSEDLVRIALFEVGFAREAMGVDLQLIPGEALSILDRYEAIARKYQGKEMTVYEKGQIAGMRWRFIYKMGGWLIGKIGPSVLQILKII